MHFRKASAMVNFTIYLRSGFRKLPRLQFWLPRACWCLQVCLNCSCDVFGAAQVLLVMFMPGLADSTKGLRGEQMAAMQAAHEGGK